MEREERYVVLKIKDIEHFLSTSQKDDLHDIRGTIDAYRRMTKKGELKAVVVESDWPEYERVWKMIEARVDGNVEEDLVTLRRKAEMFDMIRNLMGYIENGTDTSVTLFQDDTTRGFTVAIGRSHQRKGESAPSLEEAIRRMFHKYGDKE